MSLKQNDLGHQAGRFLVVGDGRLRVDFAALTAVVRELVDREVRAALPVSEDLTAALAAADLAWSRKTGDETATPDYLRHLAVTASGLLHPDRYHADRAVHATY
ncbi:hypothetical protein [Saccharothrix yanglingensis]|uniref:Uncharacterized protein n=1 Tax=Saccharothrix yanglingensis TaxID=659496 RepID=A0ABU0X1K5_9PSEU|nr:hypothetical protein [Saccharothrix yanglingensis]MDQ2586020.1 hypothetical protein [Saccharothrix yanglingensis]